MINKLRKKAFFVIFEQEHPRGVNTTLCTKIQFYLYNYVGKKQFNFWQQLQLKCMSDICVTWRLSQVYALRTCVKTTYFCNPASLLSTTSKERLGCSVLLQLLFFNMSCILQLAREHRKEGLGERIILPSLLVPMPTSQETIIQPILSVLVQRKTASEISCQC